MIGQWLCGIAFVLLLLATAFMIFPSEFRDNLLSNAPTSVSPEKMMGQYLATAIVAAGLFFVLKFLRKVVSAVVHGDPFLPENIARLRYIWIILAVTEVFRMFTNLLLGSSSGDSATQLDIRLGTWFIIFVIVVISEAFRHGAALRAEQELTI